MKQSKVEERAAAIAAAEALTTVNRDWTPDEQAQFDALAGKVQELEAAMAQDATDDQAAEAQTAARSLVNAWKVSKPEPKISRSKVYASAPNYVRDLDDKSDRRNRSLALRGWLSGGNRSELCTDEIRSAAQSTGMNIDSDRLTLDLFRTAPRNEQEIRQAQVTSTAGYGGYLVPTEFVASLEKAMLAFGGIRENAKIIRTGGGGPLTMPMSDDTGNVAAIVGEASSISVTNASFTQFTLGAYKYASSVQASWEMLQDSGINLESELGAILGERLGRGQAAHLATGDGSGKPTGLVTGSTLGATQATDNVFAYQDFLNLYHSVNPVYRKNASWVMNDALLAKIRNLTSPAGYLIFTNPTDGEPVSFLGNPIVICNDMTSDLTTAAGKVCLFGDLSAYKVREVSNIELTRQNELYSASGLVGWVIHHRLDGKLADAGTHPVKHLVTI